MRLTLHTFLTLDGVMQAPGGPDEDRDGGFAYGGWSFPFGDQDFGAAVTGWFEHASAFLLGRRTYEIFAGHWPRVTDPADPIASKLNALPKYVPTATLTAADWNNTTLIGGSGDVAAEVAKLKEQPGGELQVHGSGDLVQTLFKVDLVDTLRIWQFPVVLGTGKRLFGKGTIPRAFRLVDSQQIATGAVLHVYERAGGLKYGEVEVGQETVIFEGDAARK